MNLYGLCGRDVLEILVIETLSEVHAPVCHEISVEE